MDSLRAFDEAARGVELRLAELRRLLAGQELLAEEQQAQLDTLLPTLEAVSHAALTLRNDLLEAPETPQGFVERGYESLPSGFDPTGWTTETYVTPVTAAWGQQFAEKPGGEITVDSLFDGSESPAEITLPMDAELNYRFSELTRVYENDTRLLTGRDASGDWCLIVDDRPERAPTVMAFQTEAERGAWLGRVYANTMRPDDENRNLDEGDPTSRVPLQPIPPATPVGAGRTLAAALEEPRNP